MDDITVRWGATLRLGFTNDELGASTLTFVARKDDEVIEKTVNFTGLSADIIITAEEMQRPIGVYSYTIIVDYTDGTVEKYPDLNNCDLCDDSELPSLTILDSSDRED